MGKRPRGRRSSAALVVIFATVLATAVENSPRYRIKTSDMDLAEPQKGMARD
jgi:hypothetical protein